MTFVGTTNAIKSIKVYVIIRFVGTTNITMTHLAECRYDLVTFVGTTNATKSF